MNKENKSQKLQNIFFIITVILMCIYLFWRLFFTLPLHAGILPLIFGVLLLVSETTTAMTTFELYWRKAHTKGTLRELPEIPLNEYPDVDVFIATHNEDTELLYKTINACTLMDYPDKNKVHIFLCDDGNRQEVADLARQFGIGWLGLADNKEAKSGNYNNALSKTNSPLIATFDADMIPRHSFLMKTVPYFFLPVYIKDDGIWRKRTENEIDPDFKMGLVQTPQSFYNPDLFQYNLYSESTIPNEQDFFSREVNVMRNSSNASAYTGSNTVILRQAAVDAGGFPTDTITEDFELSVRIQKKKYTTYASTEVLSSGLSTTTVPSMIKQRTRWARGIIQSVQNTNAVFTPKLKLSGRITYLNSFLYWWSFFNRLVFILSPILFALFDFKVVDCEFWQLIFIWLPSFAFYSTSMRFLSSNIRTQRWSQVVDTILAPFLVIPVFLETIGIRQRKFKITNKEKTQKAGKSMLLYALPHIILAILSLAAIIRFCYGKYGMALFYSSVIIFWLAYNMIALIYAIFFMMGRKSPRKYERINAKEAIQVKSTYENFNADTVNLSENGIQFASDEPHALEKGQEFAISIKTDRYRADLNANLIYVRENASTYYYSASLEPADEESKRQYFAIIYDRLHSLPKKMDPWSTAYDDLTKNIFRRLHAEHPIMRGAALLTIGREYDMSDCAHGFINDFNYKYMSVSKFDEGNGSPDGIYELTLLHKYTLLLRKTGISGRKWNSELFEVVNINELLQNGFNPQTAFSTQNSGGNIV